MTAEHRRGLAPELRMLLAGACFSAWLMLLLSGHRFGGAIFVLFVAALALMPWRGALISMRGAANDKGGSR